MSDLTKDDFDFFDDFFWEDTTSEEYSTPLASQLTIEENVFDEEKPNGQEVEELLNLLEPPLMSQLYFSKGKLFDEASVSLYTNNVQCARKKQFQNSCSMQSLGAPRYCPPDLPFDLIDHITEAERQELVDLIKIDEEKCRILYTTLLSEQIFARDVLSSRRWMNMSHKQRYQAAIEQHQAINEGKILPPWDFSLQVIANMGKISVQQLLQSEEVVNNFYVAVAKACVFGSDADRHCPGNKL
jgi:hypothetical protein